MIKKILYTLLALVVLVLGLAIIIPYLYQDEIKALLKEEINKNVTATVDFEDLSLSLLKDFPDLNLAIDRVNITEGKDSEAGDTIAYFEKVDLTLDIMTVLRSEETVMVKGFHLENPVVQLKTDENGKSNYDIIVSAPSDTVATNSDPAYFDIQLENYSIENASISYRDVINGVVVRIPSLTHNGSGRYRGQNLDLDTETQSDKTSLTYNGQSYLTQSSINLELDLGINFEESSYTIREATAKINDLLINLLGKATILPEGYQLDFEFDAPGNDFGELWSIVPSGFKADYNDVTTSGSFEMNGKLEGIYSDETMPGLSMTVKANNGTVSYSQLPQKLQNIQMDLDLEMSKGNFDPTVNIRQLSFDAGQSKVAVKGELSQVKGETYIDGFVDANLNLKDIPASSEYSGQVDTDIQFRGSMSDISSQNYTKLQLVGRAQLDNVTVDMDAQPKLVINCPEAKFSPQVVEIPEFDLLIGESDMKGAVNIIDPLGFLCKDIRPIVTADLQSDKLNLDQFVSSTSSENQEVSSDENGEQLSTTLLPYNLLVRAKADIKDVQYSSYDLKQIKGEVEIDGQRVNLSPTQITYSKHPMTVSGELDQVASYVYNDGELKGTMNVRASKFDLNAFMADGSEESETASTSAETTSGVYVLPEKINVDITTDIGEVLYDDYAFKNLLGSMSLADQQIDLTNLTTQVFGGQMGLIGMFKSDGRTPASFNLKYDISKMPFGEMYEHIVSIQELAPLAKFVEGVFNSTLVVEGRLQDNMMPELGSLTASGYIETMKGQLASLPFLDKLSQRLAVSSLGGIELEDTKNWFEIKDGNFIIEPFTFEHQEISVDVAGKTSLDKTMSLDLKLSIPREKIDQLPGGEAIGRGLDWATKEVSRLGFNIGQVDTYVFGVDILGAITNPDIKVNMVDAKTGSGKDLAQKAGEEIKKKIVDTLQQEKERIVEETKERVNKEAEKVRDSINTRLEEEKKKAEEKIKSEIEKKANELVDSTTKEKLKEKAGEVLGDDAEKKIDDIKKKLDDFNPFKKKK